MSADRLWEIVYCALLSLHAFKPEWWRQPRAPDTPALRERRDSVANLVVPNDKVTVWVVAL